MTALSAEERGDLVEALLPVAAHVVTLVHGDGGPQDVQQVFAGLDAVQKDALLVVLAGMVDPERPVGDLLGWVSFDEHGRTIVPPAWAVRTTLRDMAPEPPAEDDETYVDEVAVAAYARGERVAVNARERLAAVRQAAGMGIAYTELDSMHGLKRGSTATFVSRTRRAYQARGEAFPEFRRPDAVRSFTDEEVVAIREKSAAGVTDMELAMSYGVDQTTIGHICRGRKYREVGGPIRAPRESRPGEATRVVWAGGRPGRVVAG
ncbi:hypothetical protein [Streptomyces sp. DH12]|uniref:hypothetical protein n=1 Tax=Streptomyces sp. DH12 TaxID=2857010 RepID=UPI001E356777|nr:hypothetical protein [Streptomyces sp. DH12]